DAAAAAAAKLTAPAPASPYTKVGLCVGVDLSDVISEYAANPTHPLTKEQADQLDVDLRNAYCNTDVLSPDQIDRLHTFEKNWQHDIENHLKHEGPFQ